MTTEYTPTTEAIRIAWSYFNNDTEHWENQHRMAETGLAFDRWLAAHDREIAEAAWDEGESAGTSRAMRYMSDEPHLSARPQNPYREDRA